MSQKGKRNQHEWGVVAQWIDLDGTDHEVEYCFRGDAGFITWWLSPNGKTFYGDYFTNLNDAIKNYRLRKN